MSFEILAGSAHPLLPQVRGPCADSTGTNVIPITLSAGGGLLGVMLAFSLAGVLQSLINVCKTLEGPSIETTM